MYISEVEVDWIDAASAMDASTNNGAQSQVAHEEEGLCGIVSLHLDCEQVLSHWYYLSATI